MMFAILFSLGELLMTRPAPAAQVEPPPLTAVEQLTNPRTGVTCTLQVLRARPSDPDAVRPVPESVDPGIRAQRVSPCLD